MQTACNVCVEVLHPAIGNTTSHSGSPDASGKIYSQAIIQPVMVDVILAGQVMRPPTA